MVSTRAGTQRQNLAEISDLPYSTEGDIMSGQGGQAETQGAAPAPQMAPQTPITYGMLQKLLDEVKSTMVQQVKDAMTPGPQGLASPATIRGEGAREREEIPVRRVERPYREFKVAQPFSGTGSRDAGRAFLNACDRHYEDNRRFYETADDGQRVTDIAGAFTGQAETWYNNLRASQPEVVETWSGFLEVFVSP